MQTIAIISDHHDWHSNQLEFFLKENKFKTIKVTFEELKFSFKKIEFYLRIINYLIM